jgi:hypothetical protein
VAAGLNGLVQPRGTRSGSKAQKPVSLLLPFAFGRTDAREANGMWVSTAGMSRHPPRGESSKG